jgi:hypothetical protein
MAIKLTKLNTNYLLEETTVGENPTTTKQAITKNEVVAILTEKLKQSIDAIQEINTEYSVTINITEV